MGSSPSSQKTSVARKEWTNISCSDGEDESPWPEPHEIMSSNKEQSRQRSGSFKRLTRALQTSGRRGNGLDDHDGERRPIMGRPNRSETTDDGDDESKNEVHFREVFILHQGWQKETKIAHSIADSLWQSGHKLQTVCFSVDAISYFPETTEGKSKTDSAKEESLTHVGLPHSLGKENEASKASRSIRRKDSHAGPLPLMSDILDMLENSRVFVIVLSEPLLNNSFLHRLTAVAFARGVRIVPLSCHGQEQVRRKLQLGTRLILDLHEWFFASPEEEATQYRSVRKSLIEACSCIQKTTVSPLSAETRISGDVASNENTVVASHTELEEDAHRQRRGTEGCNATGFSNEAEPPLQTSMLASSNSPTVEASRTIFDFWESCVKHCSTQEERGVESVTWEALQQVLVQRNRNNFERLCNDEAERLQVVELIRQQLFGSRTKLTRQDYLKFVNDNCPAILPEPDTDEWWMAAHRSIALQSCMVYT